MVNSGGKITLDSTEVLLKRVDLIRQIGDTLGATDTTLLKLIQNSFKPIVSVSSQGVMAMIHRLVITINMSNNIIEHFKNVPDAGTGMVSRIISEIDSDKSIKLDRYQVLIVLGKMNTQKMANTASMLKNWSTSWNYSYITSDKDVHVTKVMDKAVCIIIKMAIRDMLWKFYSWDSPNSNFYN